MIQENKRKVWILGVMLIYISLTCVGSTYLASTAGATSNFLLGWVTLSVAIGLTYGYYALYRDFRLFGWKWIVKTFKQLTKI